MWAWMAVSGLATELPAVEVSTLAEGVWLHTSYQEVEGFGLVYSHGLVVEAPEGFYVVDTAWGDAATEEVIAWTQQMGKPIVAAVVTHSHEDKMGGIGALHVKGIPTYATAQTNALAIAEGNSPASNELLLDEGRAHIGPLDVFYPVPGHTPDNLVVYIAEARVLHGGCMIRPGDSSNLGNTADADVGEWAGSVAAVEAAFPKAKVVVPSHGEPGGRKLLRHTRKLVNKLGK